MVITALAIMVLSVSSAAFFTIRKSNKLNLTIWDSSTRKLLIHFMIPLGVGGFFCLGILHYGLHGLLAPTTLIFYGLAVISASEYTFSDTNI